MSSRRRFLSIWNGVATVLFFAGIFLDFRLAFIPGVSTTIVSIFMWVIGGTVANMLFGKESKVPEYKQAYPQAATYPQETSHPQQITTPTYLCQSCGVRLEPDARFCPECGTAIDVPAK